MRRLSGWRDGLAALVLAGVTAVIYWPLVGQGKVLASFDSLVYFYPNAVYLAARLRQLQLPLWDPDLFAGVPFLANSQVGALYPLNLLYLLGPVSRVYALLVVFHVWWLAVGIYLLARASLQTSRLAACFAAIAVALGGFVGGMAGHLNQLEALSWAPLAILLVERGAAQRSWRWQVLAAIPLALAAFAGHSQELYMTGVVAGAAGLGRVLQGWCRDCPIEGSTAPTAIEPAARLGQGSGQCRVFGRRTCDLARLAVGPLLALLIAGAQLVPTLELTRLSIRASGLDFASAAAFSLPPPWLLTALLPTVGQSVPSTEWLGDVGVVTLLLAGLGLWRRPTAETWWLAGLAIAGLLLALGRFVPLYQLAFDLVPGVRLFRVPARWLTLWTLGTALLAARGVDSALLREGWGRLSDQAACQAASADRVLGKGIGRTLATVLRRRRWIGVALALVVGLALALEAYRHRDLVSWPTPATLALWIGATLALLITLKLSSRWPRLAGRAALAVLVVELWISSQTLPFQRAIWIDGVETSRLSVDHLLATRTPDRVLALGDNSFDPGDLRSLRQMLDGTLPPGAVDDYVTTVKHVEGLTPNLPLRYGLRALDGYDGGVLPLDRFDDLKQLFPVQGPSIADGRLRLQLKSAPDPHLLAWLNVRYLLMDRLRDPWIDGVPYDLAITQSLPPGSPLDLPVPSPLPTTTLGIVLRDSSGRAPTGQLVIDLGGESVILPIGPAGAAGHRIATDTDPGGAVWLWTVRLHQPALVSAVRLTWEGAQPIALRALSLVDHRTGAAESVVVSPWYRLDFLGDMKIYENRAVLPRAFLALGLDVVPDVEAALQELRSPSWQAQEAAVAVASEVDPRRAFHQNGAPGEARLLEDQPESVVVQTSATGTRLLVLTDSYYPGWQASVDGKPVPIYPVNVLFRGVVVGPGVHRVVFTFQPASWTIGLIASAIGLLATVVGLALGRR